MLFSIEKITNFAPRNNKGNVMNELAVWSNDYFLQLADRMVFKE